MFMFAVVLNHPNESAWETIRKEWPDTHFVLTDRIAFIAQDDVITTQDVANRIGLNREKKILGVVLDAEHRAGWNNRDCIEWLRKAS